jgi:hypothetical protein
MIYVHTPIEGLEFNAEVYCLMRAWHLPDLPDIGTSDKWFKVPAVKIGPVYNIINSYFDATALMILDTEGRLIKSHRVNLLMAPKIDGFELESLQREAFDIPLWEQVNQKDFPYSTMFDATRIAQRFTVGGVQQNQQMMLTATSSNITYNAIREKVKKRPCNCGKGRVQS